MIRKVGNLSVTNLDSLNVHSFARIRHSQIQMGIHVERIDLRCDFKVVDLLVQLPTLM